MYPVTGPRGALPVPGRSSARQPAGRYAADRPATERTAADRARVLLRPPAARPPVRSRADSEAVALLHRTARVLIDELPQLTDRVVALMREHEPVYRAASVDQDELWQEVHGSLSNNVASLLHPKENREAARACSWRIGTGRAAQGFPLDALLHAFRIGCAVVWEQLVEAASRDDPLGARSLVHVAADVWNFVDEHCTLVADAYRQVERQLAWRRENRSRIILQALLDGTAGVADLPEADDVLGLPEQGRYAVITLEDAGPVPGFPCLPAVPATQRAVWHTAGTTAHGIVLLGDARPEELARGLAVPPGGRAGISPAVDGLTSVGTARRLADTALRACSATGEAVALEDHYPAALVVSCPDLGTALADRVLGPVLALEPADRDVLLTTLAAWLDADGSAPRAGERLFCHRNTVLNRLRRCEQLTGRSLNRPRDVVEVALALCAHRLLPL